MSIKSFTTYSKRRFFSDLDYKKEMTSFMENKNVACINTDNLRANNCSIVHYRLYNDNSMSFTIEDETNQIETYSVTFPGPGFYTLEIPKCVCGRRICS